MRGAVAETLFCRGWLPERPRAAVLIVHGFAEHSGRYEHAGLWLAERGFAAHAYDHVGHGRSSGVRCHVRRFDDFLDDLDRVVERVRADAPDLPLVLLGHSMGGLIVATHACERAPDAVGVVLSGPPLGLGGAPHARMWLARALRLVAPRVSLDPGLDLDGLCSDPEVLEAYLADPLVERHMTASLAAELMRTVGRTGARGAEVALPLLVLHGEDDTICAARFSEDFAAAAPRGRFVRYPGMRHEILNEPGRAEVLGEIASWIEERLAEPAAARAGSGRDPGRG